MYAKFVYNILPYLVAYEDLQVLIVCLYFFVADAGLQCTWRLDKNVIYLVHLRKLLFCLLVLGMLDILFQERGTSFVWIENMKTSLNLTIITDCILGRKAEPRAICCWQLQVTERRKRTNRWWILSLICTRLVHRMGMVVCGFLCSRLTLILLFRIITSCPFLCYTEIVNLFYDDLCSFKHIFLFLMISWMALIHAVVNLAGSESPRWELVLGI